MRQSLKDFICEWNRAHWSLFFAVQEAPVVERPVSVEIRYETTSYQNFCANKQWNSLKSLVETISNGLMFVASSEEFFKRGIVEIKIASADYGYREELIVEVLRWIGEESFPKIEE